MLKYFKRRRRSTISINWKLVGRAILFTCCGTSVPTIIKEDAFLSVGLIVAGIIGFYLSNLPVDETKTEDKKNVK